MEVFLLFIPLITVSLLIQVIYLEIKSAQTTKVITQLLYVISQLENEISTSTDSDLSLDSVNSDIRQNPIPKNYEYLTRYQKRQLSKLIRSVSQHQKAGNNIRQSQDINIHFNSSNNNKVSIW